MREISPLCLSLIRAIESRMLRLVKGAFPDHRDGIAMEDTPGVKHSGVDVGRRRFGPTLIITRTNDSCSRRVAPCLLPLRALVRCSWLAASDEKRARPEPSAGLVGRMVRGKEDSAIAAAKKSQMKRFSGLPAFC